MKIPVSVLRFRSNSTAKANEKYKNLEVKHSDPVAIFEDAKKNLFKVDEDMFLIEVPQDWKEMFDNTYLVDKFISESNRIKERERLSKSKGIF